jgi:hypothetical protein
VFPAGKIPNATFSVVPLNESIKIVVGDKLKKLGENGLSTIHRLLLDR